MTKQTVRLDQRPGIVGHFSVSGGEGYNPETEDAGINHVLLQVNKGSVGDTELSREIHRYCRGQDMFDYRKYMLDFEPQDEVDCSKFFPFPVTTGEIETRAVGPGDGGGQVIEVCNVKDLPERYEHFDFSHYVRQIEDIDEKDACFVEARTRGVFPTGPPFYESNSIPGATREILQRYGISQDKIKSVDKAIECVATYV